MHETTSYEPSCVKIGLVVIFVEDGKKKREGKGRKVTKSHASVIFHLLHGGRLVYSLAWLETFILRCGVGSSVRKQARFKIELSSYWLKA